MTIGIEKIFFGYILQNKKYFTIIEPHYFKNSEIQFVFSILKKYMQISNVELPTPKQILEMVLLEDKDGLITKEILKSLLTVNLSEYDEVNFIIPRFNSWIISNRIKIGVADIVDEVRNLDGNPELDYTIDVSQKIKSIVENVTSNVILKDEDLGSDFDDVESHVQDNARFKVKTGLQTLDHMLGGGWDIGTLNILMGETNAGKSLWMQNLAICSANMGYNVLYITLEMSERKVMKRLGSMRLKIPINEYDSISKDIEFMQRKIDSVKKTATGNNDLFEKKIGKIYTKFWAAGTANVNDFDNYIEKLYERKGIKIELVIVDYLTLMVPPKGAGGDTLYTKGKLLAEGLRALGAKYQCPVISALQVAKEAWNAANISLESVPESKAIPETADTFFAIIRNEEMKRQNLYRLKMLKQRDGDFLKSQIRIKLNPTYLNLENDEFVDSTS